MVDIYNIDTILFKKSILFKYQRKYKFSKHFELVIHLLHKIMKQKSKIYDWMRLNSTDIN